MIWTSQTNLVEGLFMVPCQWWHGRDGHKRLKKCRSCSGPCDRAFREEAMESMPMPPKGQEIHDLILILHLDNFGVPIFAVQSEVNRHHLESSCMNDSNHLIHNCYDYTNQWYAKLPAGYVRRVVCTQRVPSSTKQFPEMLPVFLGQKMACNPQHQTDRGTHDLSQCLRSCPIGRQNCFAQNSRNLATKSN